MPNYDALQFDPPAPVARVSFRHPTTGIVISDVLMLFDTGADVTLIPRNCVEQLGVPIQSGVGYRLMGFDGTVTIAPSVEIDLLFVNAVFRGKFVVSDQDSGILGRDVLNSLVLLFDGPRQTWSEIKQNQ